MGERLASSGEYVFGMFDHETSFKDVQDHHTFDSLVALPVTFVGVWSCIRYYLSALGSASLLDSELDERTSVIIIGEAALRLSIDNISSRLVIDLFLLRD